MCVSKHSIRWKVANLIHKNDPNFNIFQKCCRKNMSREMERETVKKNLRSCSVRKAIDRQAGRQADRQAGRGQQMTRPDCKNH